VAMRMRMRIIRKSRRGSGKAWLGYFENLAKLRH
jgi:hypothetical protein